MPGEVIYSEEDKPEFLDKTYEEVLGLQRYNPDYFTISVIFEENDKMDIINVSRSCYIGHKMFSIIMFHFFGIRNVCEYKFILNDDKTIPFYKEFSKIYGFAHGVITIERKVE